MRCRIRINNDRITEGRKYEMMRRSGSGRLRESESFESESINPMDGVANLADVMLVFACGLMLALIINWNVDVGATVQKADIDTSNPVTNVAGLENGEQPDLEQSDGYESYGTVYRDTKTGALYVVTDK